MLDIPLNVKLGPFALSRGRKGDNPEHARADTLGNSLDDSAFPGSIASLEDDYHFETSISYPELELDELNVQFPEYLFVLCLLHGRTQATCSTAVMPFHLKPRFQIPVLEAQRLAA